MSDSAEYKSHKKLYFVVFILLAVFTAIELAVPEMQISYGLKASALSVLALIKALLVYYFFMHLSDETKWIKFIASLPIFAFLYAAMVVIESIAR